MINFVARDKTREIKVRSEQGWNQIDFFFFEGKIILPNENKKSDVE